MEAGQIVVLGFALALLVVYVLPAIIAFYRHHPNRWAILVVCLVFGATLLGWLIAVLWALDLLNTNEKRTEIRSTRYLNR